MVFILGACSSEELKADKSEKKAEMAATVNGEEILKKDYETQLKTTKAYFQQQGMNLEDLDSKTQEEFEQSVLDQLINTKLFLQPLKRKGSRSNKAKSLLK